MGREELSALYGDPSQVPLELSLVETSRLVFCNICKDQSPESCKKHVPLVGGMPEEGLNPQPLLLALVGLNFLILKNLGSISWCCVRP